ncbi:mechanosensitive ion channel domain-containing protein [Halegenticoccus tardaugens]|uniref:mechanosensitive ion channel domain-containing protein n=1 Tax=Halegenticoccus tardaugens TaxID=2071624 RepID=UPI00100A5D0C|nr:mechanosensitive ion channel domain-containing protein [Halegenticoccus tardaugens]
MAQFDVYAGAVPVRWWLAFGIILLGVILGLLVNVVNRKLLTRAGVPEAIEGTGFERMAREIGTSTVAILARLSMYFVVVLAVLVGLTVAEIQYTEVFWSQVVEFIPQVFIALLILIIGIVVGEKVELLVAERLRGVKLPEIGFIPMLAKYSVFYVFVLIALNQVGVATLALIVLLGVYAVAVVGLAAVAFHDMLSSGAAGIYLLLNQPYGIGDEVKMGDRRGIVQEIDVFVTHVESNGDEYIIPNNKVFQDGIVRIRR